MERLNRQIITNPSVTTMKLVGGGGFSSVATVKWVGGDGFSSVTTVRWLGGDGFSHSHKK